MDTRTLEQVIMDASELRGYIIAGGQAAAIADAVRKWMWEHDMARIKELGAEVERLKSSESLEKMQRDASAYRDLRERFPYLPGEEFWTYLQGAIRKWSVCEVWIGGEEILCKGVANGKQSPVYRMHECHPTADACRAAIPVEE